MGLSATRAKTEYGLSATLNLAYSTRRSALDTKNCASRYARYVAASRHNESLRPRDQTNQQCGIWRTDQWNKTLRSRGEERRLAAWRGPT